MIFRAALADPADLDRATACPADGPVPALTAGKVREEFAAHRMRPEWTWFAEDGDGRVLGRALWWGRADSERPVALDCLQVRPGVPDPAAAAAVAWRREAAYAAGLTREIERLRYEWTLAVPSATPYHRNVGYLGVVPEQRGKGLIDEVLAEITRFHAAAGADRVTATTDTVNVPMAAAFDRAGYEVTEIRLVLEDPAR